MISIAIDLLIFSGRGSANAEAMTERLKQQTGQLIELTEMESALKFEASKVRRLRERCELYSSRH